MTMQEYFQDKINIDWRLLKKQKEKLLQIINEPKREGELLSPDQCKAVQGIINLIDAIQDDAVDIGGLPEKVVFPESGVNEWRQE
jgi:hypothetical protein